MSEFKLIYTLDNALFKYTKSVSINVFFLILVCELYGPLVTKKGPSKSVWRGLLTHHFFPRKNPVYVTIKDFELKFSMCDPNILPERSVSQNFDLGLSFYFMSKNG